MPDYKKLKVGDRIRIVSFSEGDLQAWSPKDKGSRDLFTIMNRLIKRKTVRIIDDVWNGVPWFTYRLRRRGKLERHYLAISDYDSWVYVRKRKCSK